VTCCPPNLERILASLPGYFYSTSSDGIYVHLYDNSELDWHLEDGTRLKITQKTNYPWDGNVQLRVTPAQASEFAVYLRIPGWADHATVAVNRKAATGVKAGEYLPLRRRWNAGDTITLQMEMPVQVMQANRYVVEDAARVAVQRGPLVYCLEELDQPEGVVVKDAAVVLGKNPGGEFQSEHRSDLLGGVVVLRHNGAVAEKTASSGSLYSRYANAQRKSKRVPLTFIPYYAWANRAPTSMQVWTPVVQA
jgi:uncharacterized protein